MTAVKIPHTFDDLDLPAGDGVWTRTGGGAAVWEPRANFESTANKGIAGGYAPLGVDGKVASAFLPALTGNQTYVVASQAAMLAAPANRGDVAVRTDNSETFILAGDDPTILANWIEFLTPPGVQSVNGKPGPNVNLVAADVGADAAGAAAAAQAAAEAASDPAGAAAAAQAAAIATSEAYAASFAAYARRMQLVHQALGVYNSNNGQQTFGTHLPVNTQNAFGGGFNFPLGALAGFVKGDTISAFVLWKEAAIPSGAFALAKIGVYDAPTGTLLCYTDDFSATANGAAAPGAVTAAPHGGTYTFGADTTAYIFAVWSGPSGGFSFASRAPNINLNATGYGSLKLGPYYGSVTQTGVVADLPADGSAFVGGAANFASLVGYPWIGVVA